MSANPNGLAVAHSHHDGIDVLSAHGYVDLATIHRLDHAVATVSATQPHKLIVDLTGVSFLSASAVTHLINVKRELGSEHFSVVIKPARIPGNLVRIVDPDHELRVYEDLESALAAARD